MASKLTQWNPDFTFLRGPIKMSVKLRQMWNLWNESLFLKFTFCKASDAPQRHRFWPKSWWCVPLSCTQLWTNKTQHDKIFSILHQLTASPFRTWHRLINMEAKQHWTHYYNFKINYKSHQCHSMVRMAQSAMQLQLQGNSSQLQWGRPQRQLHHGDDSKSSVGNQTAI